MRILLQFPEGLKQYAFIEAERLKNEGHEVFISASACYGACDLPLEEARVIKADKIIHYGHNKFIKAKLNTAVEYVPWRVDIKLEGINELGEILRGKTIILATTVQHSHQIGYMIDVLKQFSIKVITSKGLIAEEECQVLGCDAGAIIRPLVSGAKVEAILYIGSGTFHLKALAYSDLPELEGIPVFSFDPGTGKYSEITDMINSLRAKRRSAIALTCFAKTVGIVVSIKPGQFNLSGAKHAQSRLEKLGKLCYLLVCSELTPDVIKNFVGFDALVVTACPRLSDDHERFGIPIINNNDLDLLEEMAKNTCTGAGKKPKNSSKSK